MAFRFVYSVLTVLNIMNECIALLLHVQEGPGSFHSLETG